MDIAFAISVVIGVLATINPVGNIAFFTTLTDEYSKEEEKRAATKAVITSTLPHKHFFLSKAFEATVDATFRDG